MFGEVPVVDNFMQPGILFPLARNVTFAGPDKLATIELEER